jgi:cytochrome c oxidase cbb3-type subunit 2
VNRTTDLIVGALLMIVLVTLVLVVFPFAQLRPVKPPPGLKPYTAAQLRGRAVYVSEGCMYCHSQQPRDPAQAPDMQRGWGRPSTPADYYYDDPILLGTMRTGPDLFNIGQRQPSKTWQLIHLYQPRAVVPGSIMPAFPYLFRVTGEMQKDVEPLALPEQYRVPGYYVVPTQEALDMVDYLVSLSHTYPILQGDATAQEAAR